MKVTYHDPCHIGRHMGIYKQPRELLNKIPGIELVEMRRNKHKRIMIFSTILMKLMGGLKRI